MTGRLVASLNDLERPGDFTFVGGADPDRLALSASCPCGCGEHFAIYVRYAPDAPHRPLVWDWDGNRERPTLSPSIARKMCPCLWHGWLRAGEWVTA